MEAAEGIKSEFAAEILAAIARARICPLTQTLATEANLERILAHATSHSQTPKFIQVLTSFS